MFTFKLEKEDGTPRRAGDPGTRQFRTGVQATQSIWGSERFALWRSGPCPGH